MVPCAFWHGRIPQADSNHSTTSKPPKISARKLKWSNNFLSEIVHSDARRCRWVRDSINLAAHLPSRKSSTCSSNNELQLACHSNQVLLEKKSGQRSPPLWNQVGPRSTNHHCLLPNYVASLVLLSISLRRIFKKRAWNSYFPEDALVGPTRSLRFAQLTINPMYSVET